MVFPSCSSVSSAGVSSGCIINTVYNKQLPLCSSATSPATDKERNRICRRPEELCTSDPDFKFDMRTEGDNDVGYCSLFVFFRIDYLLRPRDTERYHSPTFFPPPPGALFSSSIPHTLQPYLCPSSLETQTWMASRTSCLSSPILLICRRHQSYCFPSLAQRAWEGVTETERRKGFQLVTKGAETLEAVQYACGLSFFDMDNDVSVCLMVLYETDADCMQGTLDIVVQRTGAEAG